MAKIKKLSGGMGTSSMNPKMERKMGASLPKMIDAMPDMSGKKSKGLFVASSKKKRSSKLTY